MLKLSRNAAMALVVVSLVSGTASMSVSPAQAAAKCGDNDRTYRSWPPASQTLQRLTYINCTGRTLRRRADIAWAGDGECKRIGPWETVSLARGILKKGLVHIRGSRSC